MTSLSRDERSELIQSVNVLKVTIPRMSNLDIATTPENYSVWYEYSMGTTWELNKAIDDLLNEGATFTRQINHQLYNTYIADGANAIMGNVQAETKALVEKLLNKLQGMQKGTRKFSGSLDNFREILQSEPDVETFSKLVADLIDETAEIEQSNAQMEETLNLMNSEVDTLRSEMEKLNVVALTDPLTGINNRRAFDDAIELLLSQYAAKALIFSFLLLDIDHFKIFNDTHGHSIGDKVLAYVATTLKQSIKAEDIIARFGGEEFVILLSETDYVGAMAVADSLRAIVCQKNLLTGTNFKKNIGRINISIGVAVVRDDDDSSSITDRADKALYQAKETGRNRVVGERELFGRDGSV